MHQENFLKLSDFDFDFPADLVAQFPNAERDSARLLVRAADDTLSHHTFADLPSLLPKESLLVINDTSVLQSRLHGFLKTGARVEIFLLEPLLTSDGFTWRALAKPLKKLKVGGEILFPPATNSAQGRRDERAPVTGQIIAIEPVAAEGEVPAVQITFKPPVGATGFDFHGWLEEAGETPLPPYIHRENGDLGKAEIDRQRYETVYAAHKGSVAAPTAGLHFTDRVLDELRKIGHQIVPVTLHVGGGTFLPVRQENISLHTMHHENFMISRDAITALQQAKEVGRPIICVGTTAFRCVESLFTLAKEKGVGPDSLAGAWHATNLFIYPRKRQDRYQPQLASGLLTNFHQPKSTLFMLVSALVGVDATHRMYREAIARGYRLFSYGDTSLLLFR